MRLSIMEATHMTIEYKVGDRIEHHPFGDSTHGFLRARATGIGKVSKGPPSGCKVNHTKPYNVYGQL